MNIKLLIQGLALTTVLVSSHLASAASFDLCTGVTTKTMPDGNIITMWGYGLEATPTPDPSCGSATVPGPQLTVPDGDTVLTINLRNTLAVPTSIMVSGLSASTYLAPTFFPDSQGRMRARAMTQEAAALVGTQTYNFTATPGTYLYQSGSHPAVQVQMGLYGAVTNNTLLGEAYPSVTYDNEVVLLYSEIDPALHSAVVDLTYGTPAYPSTINYVPKYFLVNGAPYTGSTPDISAGTTGQTTLLRFLNAGLESHIPVLQGGDMNLIAEYGSPYPYQRKQFSVLLAAGQSKDALFTADTAGRYALYDRRLRLTNNTQTQGGLMSFLEVTAAAGTPVAVIDSGTTDEDTASAPIDIAGNDTDVLPGTIDVTSIYIPFQPTNGGVISNGDGTITYTPNANFNGVDTFSYVINDDLGNTSAPADVTITVNPVNDAPIATNDSYAVDAIANPTLNITTPGVLGNDTDIELDALTAVLQTDVTGGNLVLNSDGSFDYTPNIETTSDTFTYVANDGTSNSNVATVTINVTSLPATTLITPFGNITNNTPTYIWNAISGATQYKLYVSDTATGNILINQLYTDTDAVCGPLDMNTTCSLIPTVTLPDGNYRWWIRTLNASGWGHWSSPMSFSLGSVPVAATLNTPSGNIISSTPTYNWDTVSGATQYKLYVSDTATGNILINQLYTDTDAVCGPLDMSTTCSLIPAVTLPDGSYRWWIRTLNASGWGPWSSPTSFSVGSVPVAAILNTPSGNIVDSTPTYNWNAVSGATQYKLYVSDAATGNIFINQIYTDADAVCSPLDMSTTCSLTPTVTLLDGNYRWWIRTLNASGWGPWSSPTSFNLASPQ